MGAEQHSSRALENARMIELFESRIAPATFIVTSLADAGAGSLREVIDTANDHDGADVILFERGLTGTIQVSTGQLLITDTLTIKGPGATKLALDAHLTSQIFLVSDGDETRDSPLSVSGLSFFRGKATGQVGGAIHSDESLNAKDCVFIGNAADGNGGAVIVVQDFNGVPVSADIRNCTFVSNTSGASGGALTAEILGSVTVKNSLFRNNIGNSNGGAVKLENGPELLLVQSCQFLGNRCDSTSGALEIFSNGGGGPVIVRDSLFSGNSASFVGGASITGDNVLIERSAFLQNAAHSEAGGLRVQRFVSLDVRSCRFIDNAASILGTGASTQGGGLLLAGEQGSEARIIASIISGNAADRGGGVLVDAKTGRLEIVRSKIINNHATDNGGGILVLESASHDGAELSIIRSKLSGNVAETGQGGGVAMFGDGQFTMQSSQVTQNRAGMDGGGLGLFSSVPSTIIGSLIAQNSATTGGGLAAVTPLEMRASKVLGNSAALGGGINTTADLELNFCIVSGNFAAAAGGISHAIGTELKLNQSKVLRNISSDGQQIAEI
jgi:hypothetical protein